MHAGMSTIHSLASLTTKQGWKDMGNGLASLGTMANVSPWNVQGMIMRGQAAQASAKYVVNVPNMSGEEIAYDLGQGAEFAFEIALGGELASAGKLAKVGTMTTLAPTLNKLGTAGSKVSGKLTKLTPKLMSPKVKQTVVAGTRSITKLGRRLDVTLNGKLIGKFFRGNSLEIIDDVASLHGGNRILLSTNKTTTITGTLDDVNVVAKRGVNADNTFNGITAANVENVGGINILRSPKWGQIKNKYKSVNAKGETIYDWNKIADEFWETVNKPWLDDAIARGDDFRLVSNPLDTKAIYVTDDLGNFVLDVSGNKIKSIFGREIDYLKSKGYTILNDGTAIK
jgi:hypothetical protein